MKKIYLDYAATTPVDPAVFAVMKPYFSDKFGNAGSLHSFGQAAIAKLDESRESSAKLLGADFREVIFTGSATEANNLAILGTAKALKIDRGWKTPKVIVSSIEHESVLETARDLARSGIQMVYLRVNDNGLIDLDHLKKEIDENTILVSVMAANNEIGSIQPIEKIAEIIGNFKKNLATINYSRQKEKGGPRKSDLKSANKTSDRIPNYPLFHTDATQAFQYLDIKPKEIGIDLMTLSGHKIYGPKGVGTLYTSELIAKSYKLKAITTGGGQEYGLRSGTENIPAIVGFAKAAEIAGSIREKEAKRISELRDSFWKKLKALGGELNGPSVGGQASDNRLPTNLNVYFPRKESGMLLIKLDIMGVAASAGSACSARSSKPSHVLKACGFDDRRIKSSIRFTLGRPTTAEEIKEAATRIKKALQ